MPSTLRSATWGPTAPSRTDVLPLVGATPRTGQQNELRSRHGACADEVLQLAQADPALAAPLAGAGHYIAAEAVHAVTHQGALDLDDILTRRTRVSIEAADRGRAAAAVAPLVAPALGWSEERARKRSLASSGSGTPKRPRRPRRDDAAAAAAYGAVLDG